MKVYRMMKIKMKVAFEALRHGQTVLEFLISALLKTYIELNCPDSEDEDEYAENQEILESNLDKEDQEYFG